MRRNQLQVLRRGCRNTPALVAYDSIPEQYKIKIKEKLGCDPAEAANGVTLEHYIEHNTYISNFFNTYLLDDGRYLPKKTAVEYYYNAIILNAIDNVIQSIDSITIMDIAMALKKLSIKDYPHKLPLSFRRLEEKLKKYKAEGLESLISKKFLNKNAAKIINKEQRSMLVELISDPRNLDNEQIAYLYNVAAKSLQWEDITASTVAVYKDKYDLVTYAGRQGGVSFYNKKAMQVKRTPPTLPLQYWTVDGWDVELLYQEQNENITTYHNRPTLIVVLDAFCKYIIGYAIGTHETPALIQEALRNAAKHTEELFGKMYCTQQLQSDRYAIKTMSQYYNIIAKNHTPARAKNAKSKIIEPYFKYFNKRYCQLQPNWSGFGITSNKNKQPNTEFLNKHKKQFPDFDGVCQQIESLIQIEREQKKEQYVKAFANVENKLELTYENFLLNFGESTGRKVLMQPDGLSFTINGVKRVYDSFDINFRTLDHIKWEIKYDSNDFSKVLAISDDCSYRFLMEQKHVQNMALVDRTEEDTLQLKRINDYNKNLEQKVIDYRAVTGECVRELLSKNRKKELETLKKLLITDSQGQHKDELGKEKLKQKQRYWTSDAEVIETDIFGGY